MATCWLLIFTITFFLLLAAAMCPTCFLVSCKLFQFVACLFGYFYVFLPVSVFIASFTGCILFGHFLCLLISSVRFAVTRENQKGA
jgi:hypothetical protein